MANPFDPVERPEHYASGAIECIEAIEAQLTPEEYRGFLKGNVAKYLWREKLKGATQSLEKARWYLDALIKLDKASETTTGVDITECKDGFCPMPGIRYDEPLSGGNSPDYIVFPPIT